MAAGGIGVFPQSRTASHLLRTSICGVSSLNKCTSYPPTASNYLRFSPYCARQNDDAATAMSKYKESFSKRMAMAGLLPRHRIGMGVSGGPDSMALCVLAADWKTSGLDDASKGKVCNDGIDGLLAIVVDHGLRVESKDEAKIVQHRVSKMGIRCEIAQCEWLDGKPELGHLQEAARDMRYQLFQDICIQHQIGVLLIAHHADDQAELFILRLSRNSGVLGLAGMAFSSQLFSTFPKPISGASSGILLVRPLLEFSKDVPFIKLCGSRIGSDV